MGARRDLPITMAIWSEPLTDTEWEYWEGRFGHSFDLRFRKKLELCLLDFRASVARHYSAGRVSLSEFRKKIKRLIKLAESGRPLDDPFTEDQIYRHNLGDEESTFLQLAYRTLEALSADVEGMSMSAIKPECIFTRVVYDVCKEEGLKVSLTGGKLREDNGSNDTVNPTPIEEFILAKLMKNSDPKYKDVDSIRKNIDRFQ